MTADLQANVQCLELAQIASTRRLHVDRERVSPAVARILDLIEENLFEPDFGRSAVVRHLGPGGEVVARRCRAELGETLAQYITLVRLTGAIQPVGRTETPIARIAELLGWAAGSGFSKAFRRVFGLTPREARTKFRATYPHLQLKADAPPHAPRLPPDERERFAKILARELEAWLTTPSRMAMLADGRIQLDPMVLELMDLGDPN